MLYTNWYFYALVHWTISEDVLPVTGMFFMCQECFSLDRNFILMWHEIFCSDIKFLSVTQIIFLWHNIPSCDREVLPVTVWVFVWLLFFSCFYFAQTKLKFLRQSVVTTSKILCDFSSFCVIQNTCDNPTLV